MGLRKDFEAANGQYSSAFGAGEAGKLLVEPETEIGSSPATEIANASPETFEQTGFISHEVEPVALSNGSDYPVLNGDNAGQSTSTNPQASREAPEKAVSNSNEDNTYVSQVPKALVDAVLKTAIEGVLLPDEYGDRLAKSPALKSAVLARVHEHLRGRSITEQQRLTAADRLSALDIIARRATTPIRPLPNIAELRRRARGRSHR